MTGLRRTARLGLRLWDRASIYLPIILMGLLALGTYWLVRNTPVQSAAPGDKPVSSEPDYFMRGFSVKTFDGSGRLKSEVVGKEARHFPDSDTLEIDVNGYRQGEYEVTYRILRHGHPNYLQVRSSGPGGWWAGSPGSWWRAGRR